MFASFRVQRLMAVHIKIVVGHPSLSPSLSLSLSGAAHAGAHSRHHPRNPRIPPRAAERLSLLPMAVFLKNQRHKIGLN